MFACLQHWRALPKRFQDAIWAEYREGQERDKRPSARYLAVQTAARARLAFKLRDEAAAKLCAELMLDANVHRTNAVRAGFGDPFEQLHDEALMKLPLLDADELAVRT